MNSLITGGFFVLGISAWHLIAGRNVELFSRATRIALVVTGVSAMAAATTGHAQAQFTAKAQPMKIAAVEGLWEMNKLPAAFRCLRFRTRLSYTGERELRLPYLLSVLAHNNVTAPVEGMKELQAQYEQQYGPGDYIPPVTVVYWAFRIMVGLGMLFIAVSLLGSVPLVAQALIMRRPRFFGLLDRGHVPAVRCQYGGTDCYRDGTLPALDCLWIVESNKRRVAFGRRDLDLDFANGVYRYIRSACCHRRHPHLSIRTAQNGQ